jgi:hypothetical protein
MKRLDLDAARSKQKKNKMLNSQHNTPVAMTDVSSFFSRFCQDQLDSSTR